MRVICSDVWVKAMMMTNSQQAQLRVCKGAVAAVKQLQHAMGAAMEVQLGNHAVRM